MKTILQNDWEFNILNIYNYNKRGSFFSYFDFIKKNHKKLDGDLLEAGVHQGKSLLSVALFLKEIGSKKKIYGYDSWAGFPKNQKNNSFDEFSRWKEMLKNKRITKKHYEEILKNRKYIRFLKKKNNAKIDSFNLSTSGDFSNCSISDLRRKIKFLNLDNIILIKGDFDKTFQDKSKPFKKLFSAIIDADLYDSYQKSLPFIWKNLVKNGFLFLDEYYSLKFPGARIACDNFFKNLKSKPQKTEYIKRDFERWFVKKID
jgi:hypothetical protein